LFILGAVIAPVAHGLQGRESARRFERSFAAPTPAQKAAWPAIAAGRPVLIAAPTGSGKTLAAFLAAIDSLVKEGLAGGPEDATQIVYVSPLKALSNDIRRNLETPLAGIRAELRRMGPRALGCRCASPLRQEGAGAARPRECRGSPRPDLSRPDRLRGKPGPCARHPRSSADPPDDCRLPRRGDGLGRF
jgi:ATP-dependent Lhr-like helicase